MALKCCRLSLASENLKTHKLPRCNQRNSQGGRANKNTSENTHAGPSKKKYLPRKKKSTGPSKKTYSAFKKKNHTPRVGGAPIQGPRKKLTTRDAHTRPVRARLLEHSCLLRAHSRRRRLGHSLRYYSYFYFY